MKIHFTDISSDPERFFDLLPPDWREGIEPYWPSYKDHTRVLILEDEDEVVAGGLVFSDVSPDTICYGTLAKQWFDRGYLYLGFIWVKQQCRGKGLGSLWLKELQQHYPGQKYWLAIEEEHLKNFYQKNGYLVAAETTAAGYPEWIMVNQLQD